MKNEKFVIEPHFRLQEWVADEKGYFRDEGLDYVFNEMIKSSDGKAHDREGAKAGAFQTFEAGRKSDVNCACHWTVNVAAAKGHGRLWADIYSVAPAGIFVPQDSLVKQPEDLAGVPISVGYQSGSHYSSIQALEPYLAPGEINLSFSEGMLFKRLDNLLEGKSQASALFSGPYYLADAADRARWCRRTGYRSRSRDTRTSCGSRRPGSHWRGKNAGSSWGIVAESRGKNEKAPDPGALAQLVRRVRRSLPSPSWCT